MLTELQLQRFTPRSSKRIELWDKNGLGIRIGKKKKWFLKYNFEGVAKRITLGEYPAISLVEARQKASEAILEMQRGVDPGAAKQEARNAYKAAPTFIDIIQELWERELQHKRSGKGTRGLLERDVVPAWGKRKVAEVKRRDIVLLLDKIAERAPITRNRVHGALSRLFNFAAERGIIDDSPCTRIRKLPEKGRSRVLNNEEIKLFWDALDLDNIEIDIYRLSKLALKLILLTGQRPGEVTGMRWEEIDEDNIWNIPAERMKGQEPHTVPLTGLAMDIIEQARQYSSDSPFVFRSSYKEDTPMTAHALSRAVTRHWQEMGFEEKFTPHDLRRTLRTRLAEICVDDIIGERVLGHKLQGIMAVYNRHSYDNEKRQALGKWDLRLRQIVGIESEGQTAKIILFQRAN
ncbi:MAG TPA: integrase [Flavobacteriales bacterium]|nr:integrase [Flavobacteriales bacterium]